MDVNVFIASEKPLCVSFFGFVSFFFLLSTSPQFVKTTTEIFDPIKKNTQFFNRRFFFLLLPRTLLVVLSACRNDMSTIIQKYKKSYYSELYFMTDLKIN